jgi:hypothetical protein
MKGFKGYYDRRGNLFNRCVHDAAIGSMFYRREEIVVNNYLERKLEIGHRHEKQIYVLNRFVVNEL